MKAWQSIDTLEELHNYFHSESVCASLLYQMKWPEGFVCSRCRHGHAYIIQTRRLPLYECRMCRHQSSLTTGTVMEGSRTPLQKWFTAFWLASRPDAGINAVQLSSIIKVTYKTAWLMLHKIRAAISHADAARPLEGKVQGIVAFQGLTYHSMLELHPREYPLIVSASVKEDGLESKFKMKLVKQEHLSGKLLLRSGCDHFTALHVTETALETTIIRHPYRTRRDNRLYQAFNRARRWMNDTFHGIGEKYLQRYLDEFCFRLNATTQPTSTWERLLCVCMSFPAALEHLFAHHDTSPSSAAQSAA
ncbi:transposase [Paenibacillus sp. MER TA 81-3]|uniref:transposase n=1 Tax=Paenibacillus sp. MER TA 81-3 TaxID=2939573 RepID=UPI00203A8FCD|nr:transposase [Paenibacillus sp. MER TA 81-3]MCM3339770.1 transposase [Paenibacillus sp. MER TA 81-3]